MGSVFDKMKSIQRRLETEHIRCFCQSVSWLNPTSNKIHTFLSPFDALRYRVPLMPTLLYGFLLFFEGNSCLSIKQSSVQLYSKRDAPSNAALQKLNAPCWRAVGPLTSNSSNNVPFSNFHPQIEQSVSSLTQPWLRPIALIWLRFVLCGKSSN